MARLDERLSADTTQRAIDRAGGTIRDAAAGRKSAAKVDQARRGVRGTGVGDQGLSRIDEAAARAQAGSAADISLGRERDKDALVIGGQGIMAAPGASEFARTNALNAAYVTALGGAGDLDRLAQGWAGQNLQNYSTVRGLDLQQQQVNQQQLAQWLAMMRAYG